MSFLPIVSRELRVAARRRVTYWIRPLFALAGLVIGWLVFLEYEYQQSHQLGKDVFRWLAIAGCTMSVSFGFLTADCLSSEKREGTLGLLFLTDLKGYDVILGKLAGVSLTGFYGLLATFPVMAVPLLLGGVTNAEFWRTVVVLVNTALFTLTLGMLVSALSRQAGKAYFMFLALLLVFAAVLPACAGVILALAPGHRSQVADLLLLPCPLYSLARADDVFYSRAGAPFWRSVGVIHGLAWLLLALAGWGVRRAWQDKPAEAGLWGWRRWWGTWDYGTAKQRRRLRARLLELNPICWLTGRVRSRTVYVWMFLGAVAVFWGWGCAAAGAGWFNEGVYFPTAILLNSALKLWVAATAGRQFGEDRASGALDLVLSTRLSVREILRGQWLSLWRQFSWPVLAVIGIELIFLAASLQREPFTANPLNPVLWLAGIVMLLVDLAALGWVAMWEAMTARKPNLVMGLTVLRLLVAPWLLWWAIMVVISYYLEPVSSFVWPLNVGLWFGLGLMADLAYGLTAWWHLRRSFRQLAVQRFAPEPPPLARWLARLRRRA